MDEKNKLEKWMVAGWIVGTLVTFAFWGAVVYVILHFLAKAW